jgi:cytochrome bd-type quinol oxidase subunit 1
MLTFDRLQFAVTIIFHRLFPQLTMGLIAFYTVFIYRLFGRRTERQSGRH